MDDHSVSTAQESDLDGIHSEIEIANSDQKKVILMRLIEDHPEGRLHLAPRLRPDPNQSRTSASAPPVSGVDLESVDLHGMNLAQAHLAQAILRKANLNNCHLDGANLAGADLAGARLRKASLREADLRGAKLEDAHLPGANLRFADLRDGILDSADLRATDLWGAKLDGAELTGANLKQASLNDASLCNADLSGASLRNAKLPKADLRGSNLQGVDLRGAQMRGANLCGASLAGANLQGVDLNSCDLTNVSFARVSLEKTQLLPEQLGGAIGEELARDYRGAGQGYLALEKNFAALGDKDAARWAYLKRRRMEKRSAGKCFRESLKSRQFGKAFVFFSRFATDQFVELLCNYGESIPRVLACIVTLQVVFMLIYSLTGNITPVNRSARGASSPAPGFLDIAIFSLLAMTTAVSPVAALDPLVKVLTSVQALLGISLTGLLGFVVGNRIRR